MTQISSRPRVWCVARLLFGLGLNVATGFAATETAEPPAPVFDPLKFGAKGNGVTNDHDALQRAIDACRITGGSVYLHDGRFLTGQIALHSDMTLYIAASATLLGIQSTDEKDYPAKSPATDNHMNGTCQKRLIWGEGLKNVTITGGGTIDGQGGYAAWHSGKEKVIEKLRPSILEIARSEKVEVSQLTIRRPGMWTQVYMECNGLVLRNLKVDTENLPSNRDGMDICDCHDVLIEGCDITAQDDGICFKSGSQIGCENVVVRNCTIDKLGVSAGNGVKFGTPTQGVFRNVLCEHVIVKRTGNSAFTWESVDGSIIENVEVRDCQVSEAAQVISLLLGQRRGTSGKAVHAGGAISHVVFRNITAEAGTKPIACFISGAPGLPIRDVQFIGLKFRLPGGAKTIPATTPEYAGDYPEGTRFGDLPGYGFYVRHADGVTFTDCAITTDRHDVRPWIATADVEHLTVTRVQSNAAVNGD